MILVFNHLEKCCFASVWAITPEPVVSLLLSPLARHDESVCIFIIQCGLDFSWLPFLVVLAQIGFELLILEFVHCISRRQFWVLLNQVNECSFV